MAISHVSMPQDSPREVVLTLVTASHGLNAMSGPEVMGLLDRVRQNPNPYIPFLRRYLTPEDILASQDSSAVLAAENAAMVLAQVGGSAGRDALTERLTVLNSSADKLQQQISARERQIRAADAKTASVKSEFVRLRERLGRLVRVKRTLVNALASVGDPGIKDIVLERLDREDYATQLTYIRYLGRTGKGDAKVKQRLENMLRDKRSQFYRSQTLMGILQSL